MRRWLTGSFALLFVGALALTAGTPQARASEPYEKVTGLKCENCHKHTKDEFKKLMIKGWDATQDYKDCGKECGDFLKKQPGYAALKKGEERTPKDAKHWAEVLDDKNWKCSKQSKPGQPIKP